MSRQWYGCQCLGFLTFAQTLMHAIAYWGCTNTVMRESALKVNSGRKIPSRTWDSNPRQYCTWLFSGMLYQWSFSTRPRCNPTPPSLSYCPPPPPSLLLCCFGVCVCVCVCVCMFVFIFLQCILSYVNVSVIH